MVRIVFLHPDLGIGGAERLIVDAALALQKKKHEVHILTTHHDVKHCFTETRPENNEPALLNVTTVGDWLPRTICGKFAAFCATIRMLWAAFHLAFLSDLSPQVIICDQISNVIPFLPKHAKIIFYCHFPDQLLTQRGTVLKKLYRKVMDYAEEYTTGKADLVLVNSYFTQGVYEDTFKTLANSKPSVLYPSLNTEWFDDMATKVELGNKDTAVTFLSINRYERKKNIALAIKAFEHLLKRNQGVVGEKDMKLIIAGGYDRNVVENIQYYSELQKMAEEAGISSKVKFLKSPDDVTKVELLRTSDCLLYTPSKEHFGIVPIEAMYNKLPVIAVNDGGPLETVVDGETDRTGYLIKPDPEEFSAAMQIIVDGGSDLKNELGENGRNRVLKCFSFNTFAAKLNDYVNQVM